MIIIPSIWIFYRTVTNSLSQARVEEYVSETIVFPGAEIVKEDIAFEGGSPKVSVVLFGDLVPENLTMKWIKEFENIFKGELTIVQGENPKDGLLEMTKLVNLYSEGRAEAKNFQDQINQLESELQVLEKQLIPSSLADEIKVNYPGISTLSVGTVQGGITDSTSGYRIPVAFVTWSDTLSPVEVRMKNIQLRRWLEIRLQSDTILVK